MASHGAANTEADTTSDTGANTVLVLDLGAPVIVTPFEIVDHLERHHGLPEGSLGWFGPFNVEADEVWQQLSAKEITELQFWDIRCAQISEIVGETLSVRDVMTTLYQPARPELIRTEAIELITQARNAGHQVVALTNDLRSFHPEEWVHEMGIYELFPQVVDGSLEGYLKPDPRLFNILRERLGVDYENWVFVDDQIANVEGARALGIPTIHFVATQPQAGFDAARELLGLPVGATAV